MTYISNESFRSKSGDRFSFGQEISDYFYNKLTRDEKMKFRRKYSSDDDSTVRSSPDQGIYWNPLPDYGDSSPSPSSHKSSFGGYEGGSSGGAGSDSSWDSGSSDSGGSDGGSGGSGGDGGGGGGD